jgi:hypothetical protein
MDRHFLPLTGLLAIVFAGMLAAGCSKPSYLDVRYALPPSSHALSGMQAALDIRDERSNTDIFAGDAKKEFEYFTGIFSLSLERGGASHVAGTFDLPMLFKEAFRQRLTAMGVEVVSKPSENVPLVEIVLQRFLIEGVGQKWIADVGYEARLVVEGRTSATQTVSGKAERFKLMGHSGAEKVVGEIFTDSVNKFNLPKLLGKAGME